MTRPLYQLGSFQFDLPNGSPQSIDWSDDYRWEQQDRLLREPAQQWMGIGTREATFEGVLFPGFAGRQSTVQMLRTMAERGEPYMLTDGSGRVYGRWCIRSLREGKSVFMDNGDARRIAFSMVLVRYGEDGTPSGPAAGGQIPSLEGFSLPTIPGLGQFLPAGGFTDWLQAGPAQALTQAATGSGFSLGQLASLASTGARLAGQISSGDYVGAALGTFGLFGIDPAQAGAWAQVGINAANLAQSFAQGNGPTGMAIAVEAASLIGAPAMQELGLVSQQNRQAIASLLRSSATVGEILKVDPRATDALRPLITLTGN